MVCIGCSQGLSGAGGEVLVGLYSRGARSGGVHIAGTRSVTSKSNGDVDICSFLQCWESLSQREGLADATSGGCTTPMVALGRQLWAPVWASVPWRRGRWSFGWPWALLEWLGRRHPCLLCKGWVWGQVPKGILVIISVLWTFHQKRQEALPCNSTSKAFPETSRNFFWRQSDEGETTEEWGKAARHFEQFQGRITYNLYGTGSFAVLGCFSPHAAQIDIWRIFSARFSL